MLRMLFQLSSTSWIWHWPLKQMSLISIHLMKRKLHLLPWKLWSSVWMNSLNPSNRATSTTRSNLGVQLAQRPVNPSLTRMRTCTRWRNGMKMNSRRGVRPKPSLTRQASLRRRGRDLTMWTWARPWAPLIPISSRNQIWLSKPCSPNNLTLSENC